MSGLNACKCTPRSILVLDRNCNYSAFSGYHRTYSDYSRVGCTKCGHTWRTKAGYVDAAPDGTYEELDRVVAEYRKTACGCYVPSGKNICTVKSDPGCKERYCTTHCKEHCKGSTS